jgi:hypothetical protein
MRYLFLAFAVLMTPLSASAEGRNGFTLGLGTLGVEGIYTRNLNSWFDLVLGYSTLDYDDTFSQDDGTSFKASATIDAPRIGLQFFPLGFLNMEVGVVAGAPELGIQMNPDESGNYMIGDTEYPSSDIGTFSGAVSFENDTAPYVLFGIGRNVGGGLGLSLSAGVIQYGSPTADLTHERCDVGSNDNCSILADEIAAEERDINNDLNEFELWPFLRVGLTYSF